MSYVPPPGNDVRFNFESGYNAPDGSATGFHFNMPLSQVISDNIGTLRDTFRIHRATLDASGLTGARTFTLQDLAGVLAHLIQANKAPHGRLTLTSGMPVTVSDVTAATSIYYTPYVGELVPIYNGTVWTPTVFTQMTLALDSDTGHTGDQESGKNFDLFVVNDAGTLRLGTGPAWASDTARGTGAGTTELERKSGLWTNKVSMTLRWGSASGNTITVAANQGTYVGTMRASANGQCEDSFSKRFLWNTYNRVLRIISVFETADSWTYSTAAYRQMNANAANQLDMVRGLDEDAVKAIARQSAGNSTSSVAYPAAAIGLDSTTTPAADCFACQVGCNLEFGAEFHIPYAGWPGLGYHFLTFLEQGAGTDTQTWYGDAGVPSLFQTGGYAECLA